MKIPDNTIFVWSTKACKCINKIKHRRLYYQIEARLKGQEDNSTVIVGPYLLVLSELDTLQGYPCVSILDMVCIGGEDIDK